MTEASRGPDMESNAQSFAFSRPGGERCGDTHSRPINLVYLARQTLGDRAVEEEVLALFAQQVGVARERLAAAEPAERSRLAHTLKGSARSVGAFPIADCAAEIELAPRDEDRIGHLATLIDEVRDFIAAISR